MFLASESLEEGEREVSGVFFLVFAEYSLKMPFLLCRGFASDSVNEITDEGLFSTLSVSNDEYVQMGGQIVSSLCQRRSLSNWSFIGGSLGKQIGSTVL